MTFQEINARYVLPTVEEKTAYGYKRQDPYTKLFEERIIFMGQPIDDTVANDVMAAANSGINGSRSRHHDLHQLTWWIIHSANSYL